MRKSLDLVSGKQAFFQSAADTGIQRPSVFEELLLNKRAEIGFLEEIVVSAAHLAVLLVGGLSGGGFAAKNISFIQCHCSALDLVADGVRRTADLPGDPVGTPAILESGLNQNPVLK